MFSTVGSKVHHFMMNYSPRVITGGRIFGPLALRMASHAFTYELESSCWFPFPLLSTDAMAFVLLKKSQSSPQYLSYGGVDWVNCSQCRDTEILENPEFWEKERKLHVGIAATDGLLSLSMQQVCQRCAISEKYTSTVWATGLCWKTVGVPVVLSKVSEAARTLSLGRSDAYNGDCTNNPTAIRPCHCVSALFNIFSTNVAGTFHHFYMRELAQATLAKKYHSCCWFDREQAKSFGLPFPDDKSKTVSFCMKWAHQQPTELANGDAIIEEVALKGDEGAYAAAWKKIIYLSLTEAYALARKKHFRSSVFPDELVPTPLGNEQFLAAVKFQLQESFSSGVWVELAPLNINLSNAPTVWQMGGWDGDMEGVIAHMQDLRRNGIAVKLPSEQRMGIDKGRGGGGGRGRGKKTGGKGGRGGPFSKESQSPPPMSIEDLLATEAPVNSLSSSSPSASATA